MSKKFEEHIYKITKYTEADDYFIKTSGKKIGDLKKLINILKKWNFISLCHQTVSFFNAFKFKAISISFVSIAIHKISNWKHVRKKILEKCIIFEYLKIVFT
mgnify:CR=1 FL=1